VASFGVRAGSRSLESDLTYTKYLSRGGYRFDFGRHHVQAAAMAGGITGHPPLFERFALGDATTLRGWDKYEITPAGGDRMVYSSVEYRYTASLYSSTSVRSGTPIPMARPRVDRLGFHRRSGLSDGRLPLNTDNLTAVLALACGSRIGAGGAPPANCSRVARPGALARSAIIGTDVDGSTRSATR
jgi:hypothetical protein